MLERHTGIRGYFASIVTGHRPSSDLAGLRVAVRTFHEGVREWNGGSGMGIPLTLKGAERGIDRQNEKTGWKFQVVFVLEE